MTVSAVFFSKFAAVEGTLKANFVLDERPVFAVPLVLGEYRRLLRTVQTLEYRVIKLELTQRCKIPGAIQCYIDMDLYFG